MYSLMKNKNESRRKFIRNAGLGVLGAGLLKRGSSADNQQINQDDVPKIQSYRRLGRTGAMVSDLGCGAPRNGSVLKSVLKSGVNSVAH